jgi:ATP-binding cassette subfamily F protein uup
VLDEPTNDLDLETLDLLEEMIDDYPGTVMLVSHDRDFLDRTVSGVAVAEGDGRWNVYAGGYSDMVAQRGEGVTAKAVAKAEKAPREKSDAPAAAAPKSRLTFKDKHALETLPARIAKLEAEITKLSKTIADPGLYAKDRAAFDNATAALGKAQAELAQAEDDWLRLEELREQVEAR